MIKLSLLGSQGRMGQWVSKLVSDEFKGRATLIASADQGAALDPLLDADVVIDFSLPAGMSALARKALERSKPLPGFVVASTGWTLDERAPLLELAKRTPVLMSSNFSTGVLALLEILKTAAPLLEKLGYTPVIVETHHKHKKDAPSGTAVSLQRVISPTGPGNVPAHSVRAGEVVGDHVVGFYGKGDRLELSHFAQDRSIFARGAIEAALWLNGQRTGYQGTAPIGVETFFKSTIQGQSPAQAQRSTS